MNIFTIIEHFNPLAIILDNSLKGQSENITGGWRLLYQISSFVRAITQILPIFRGETQISLNINNDT